MSYPAHGRFLLDHLPPAPTLVDSCAVDSREVCMIDIPKTAAEETTTLVEGVWIFLELHILTFNWSLHTFVHNSQNTVSSQIKQIIKFLFSDADCHNIYF